jgi:hypothetical protein
VLQQEYNDEASALHAVKKNEVWAAVHFVKNYTQLFAQYFAGITNGTVGNDVKINSWVDLGNHIILPCAAEDIGTGSDLFR